jgi:hypothetical protein
MAGETACPTNSLCGSSREQPFTSADALAAARDLSRLLDGAWLPPHYRWLEEQ